MKKRRWAIQFARKFALSGDTLVLKEQWRGVTPTAIEKIMLVQDDSGPSCFTVSRVTLGTHVVEHPNVVRMAPACEGQKESTLVMTFPNSFKVTPGEWIEIELRCVIDGPVSATAFTEAQEFEGSVQ